MFVIQIPTECLSCGYSICLNNYPFGNLEFDDGDDLLLQTKSWPRN